MDLRLVTDHAALSNADLLILPAEGETLPDGWGLGDEAAAALNDALATKQAVVVYSPNGRVALVPVGEEADAEARRLAGAKGAAEALRLKSETVALALPEGADAAAAVAEGFLLGAYRFTRYRTSGDEAWDGPAQVLALAPEGTHDAVRAAYVRAEATRLARDLVNRSPDETTPQQLGALTKEAGEAAGLTVDVWDKARITEEGMGGLLAVNRGSMDPPAFIVMEHAPAGHEDEAPVVLVGKAVTFDTGGLSLKPTKGSMDHMKADMGGGAAMIGAMVAVARLGLPLRVVALVPATDNRPGENAYVPGDVVRMHSGATVEVLNTDAEGRMILADALSYAHRYAPRLVIDAATLTGAQVIALGDRVAAVLTNEDDGADDRLRRFVEAGRRTGDLVHPLPTFAFYKDALKSDVADLQNVGGRPAGTITAAKFLEHFTQNADGEGYPWVHLDIAGPGFLDSGHGYRPKGATGFGVRLLVEVLAGLAAEG